MRPRSYRRFSIADAMILVVAGAVAALLGRSIAPSLNEPPPSGFAAIWLYVAWVQQVGSCAAVPGMAAMIAIRLRRPRPSRLRLSYQPGFVACVAVMASLIPGLAWYASIRHRPGFQRSWAFDQVWYCVTEWSNTAVLGAWIALILARRWRPEPSWIDRTGRVLGFFWIGLLVLSYGIQALLELQRRGFLP